MRHYRPQTLADPRSVRARGNGVTRSCWHLKLDRKRKKCHSCWGRRRHDAWFTFFFILIDCYRTTDLFAKFSLLGVVSMEAFLGWSFVILRVPVDAIQRPKIVKSLFWPSKLLNLVPKKGLEPPHPCEYMDLNHARLPIPPLRHG